QDRVRVRQAQPRHPPEQPLEPVHLGFLRGGGERREPDLRERRAPSPAPLLPAGHGQGRHPGAGHRGKRDRPAPGSQLPARLRAGAPGRGAGGGDGRDPRAAGRQGRVLRSRPAEAARTREPAAAGRGDPRRDLRVGPEVRRRTAVGGRRHGRRAAPAAGAELRHPMALAPVLLAAAALLAETSSAQPPFPPDDRFKAAVLLVVAPPDDDTLVSPFLIRALEQKRRVAVVYGTRGDSGGNAVGQEQAGALAAIREMEARRALGSLGIVNVWFLDGRDTASQDVLNSLETWGHGLALEKTVRYMRLVRPEVVLTWLPVSVVGENHGDHQAAGVIATEAFDLAGDPAAFPAQLAAPRNRASINNLGEGLQPWTPRKLYYFSDASRTAFLKGFGPATPVTDTWPVAKVPYATLAARHYAYYQSQIDPPEVRQALAAGMFEDAIALFAKGDEHFWDPLRLVLGKSR